MKKLLIILCLFAIAQLAHAEGPVVDPTITPTWTITCADPIQREDGTALAVGEIATRNFWVSTDKTSWQEAGNNSAACQQVYNLGTVADGQYYYTVSATDTDGRQSVFAIDNPENATTGELGYAALVVKRLAPPKPPSGITGSAQ